MITEPSWDESLDRIRPCIGYAALCRAIPDCSRAALAGNLRAGLGKVADIVDIGGALGGGVAGCDAVLAMDCASLVPEPYFIYLCSEQGNALRTDPAVYERALGLLAENGCVAQSLAEGAGIPREKIHVIPPALPTDQNSPRIPPYLREAPRHRLLLCVSDCCDYRVGVKAVPLLMDVLDILRREHGSHVRLTISGLEDWPADRPLPDGITLRPAVPIAQRTALFDSHDLLVVPSALGYDGLSEALSRGVPCVAARASEMSDAILSGITGAVVKDGNAAELAAAIASVLSDDDIYRNCFERAPAMAAYFSWERVARQVTYVMAREVGLRP